MPHVVKVIIFLNSFIQILVYYLLEASLIKFIATSFVSFFFFFLVVKFVITLAFFQKEKHITKYKELIFVIKNYDINH